ncbi:MAG: nucleoside deaminase [Sphaerochaeta sp.]|jgi:tRNA(Arg) A34 adenosine deaminase TadA|uniref:nucleoside deaminase n=1 Tax=unclassified Sphaerochaeta TaxID=2637943 RepID=UPI000AD7D545|nr:MULTISPECIES: nucleoside deaminase [unclassified Sphaerochaeta]MCK9599281.1 nucleoside deaminase [Sphaerochaeta sp.]HPE93626.1 nucleoside deaminase [Sphaerochaeta sp.]
MAAITRSIPNAQDIRLLYETVRIAGEAKRKGNHPFGALLADKDGNILLEQENSYEEGGSAMHAETLLLFKACKLYDPSFLATCTLYTNAEPCVMCTGALYWTNVRRLVFGITEARLLELTGADEQNPTFDLPSHEVLAHGQKDIEVVGPTDDKELEKAIVADHLSFWVH